MSRQKTSQMSAAKLRRLAESGNAVAQARLAALQQRAKRAESARKGDALA